jgi:Cu2+-containing amine oxidase
MFFPLVKLSEPSGASRRAGRLASRSARRLQTFDCNANTLHEAVVDLNTNTLDSWTQKPGAQPVVSFGEYADADGLVRAYAPWKKAMRDRGIDPKDVYLDGWAAPDTSNAAPAGTRILKELSFYRGALPNPYDRPIEGVVDGLNEQAQGRRLRGQRHSAGGHDDLAASATQRTD